MRFTLHSVHVLDLSPLARHAKHQSLKRAWLGWSRNNTELVLMRAPKSAVDPGNLLSPGRIIEF